jgi:hypothetical protein
MDSFTLMQMISQIWFLVRVLSLKILWFLSFHTFHMRKPGNISQDLLMMGLLNGLVLQNSIVSVTLCFFQVCSLEISFPLIPELHHKIAVS